MRRTIRTLIVGGVLLTATACGTAPGTPNAAGTPAVGSAPAGSAPAAKAPPGVGSTCDALGQAYSKNIATFAESLTNLVSDPKAVAKAQQSLAGFATAVSDATKASENAELKADGKLAADQMLAKSKDKKFFAAIKTGEDVNQTMGATLTGWLSPVTRHCS
jgi:hypothetical protein